MILSTEHRPQVRCQQQQPTTKLLVATTPTSSTTLRALPTVFIWSGCWYQSQLAIKDIKPSPAEFLLRESSYLLWKMIKISVAYFVSNHEEFKNEAKSNLELMFCSAVSTQAGLTTHLSCSGLECCERCGGKRWERPWSRCLTPPAVLSSPGISQGPTSGRLTETEQRINLTSIKEDDIDEPDAKLLQQFPRYQKGNWMI